MAAAVPALAREGGHLGFAKAPHLRLSRGLDFDTVTLRETSPVRVADEVTTDQYAPR